MLSRTAENLYWLARYMERAENIARLLDVGQRMASLSLGGRGGASEWHSAIVAAGCERSYYAKHDAPSADAVIHHLARDRDNPSSILCCLDTARQDARAVRTALTADMWEAINSTWLELTRLGDDDFTLERLRPFLDWVKERSLLFGGTMTNTMMRNDAYWFARLGTFLERADNTARILDVKYHVLLPDYEAIGGTLDYYQWAAILRSVSALRAYHWIYRDRLKASLVAELLILRPEMPRSLANCLNEINMHLDFLANAYGTRGECHRLAGQSHAALRFGKVEQIFHTGLHEFLTTFIDGNTALGAEITKQYLV
jgi:uncharacterized alpha-E superfamily protein